MNASSDSPATPPPPSPRAPERPAGESAEFSQLRAVVATALERRADEIAQRWEQQSRDVALREAQPPQTPDEGVPSRAVALVQSFAAALASDGAMAEDGVALGLAVGHDAFDVGASLHHMLKGLDLLTAMTLYAVESVVAEVDTPGIGVADGVRVCRRLQQSAALITLAAAKGYTQAVSDGLRDRFRHLRHDLRNPLGTIKSVLSLMDDETMPAEARTHPRFRAMAERNARSLDEMIVARLSDAAALLPALSHQSVSLRTIACAVRRDLRAEAEARDTAVTVASERVRVRVDAVSLELLLHALLLAALQETGAGEELSVDFGEATEDRASLILRRDPLRTPIADPAGITRLTTLAGQMGARITFGEEIVVSVPVRRAEAGAQSPTADPGAVAASQTPRAEVAPTP